MYNKLFTKILDSTIWLEQDSTRLVWITFLAVMDEDGFVALSSVGNVAARARVSPEDAERAIRALEGPDSVDSEQEHQGRRIERVPYGWMVLNAKKYRDLIRREHAKELTRKRVEKHRNKQRSNADVTQDNEKVTTSVAVTDAVTESKSSADKSKAKVAPPALPDWINKETWNDWLKTRTTKSNTDGALKAAIRKLERLRAQGHDPNSILEESLANGWRGLFAPDAKRSGQRSTLSEQNRAAAAEAVRRMEEQDGQG